jgi:zinc protease
VGPVDVVVYPMDVKDVVTVLGVMPLGDAVVASRPDNPVVADLTSMMVQRGTTAHDKYQIADTLSALGAQSAIHSDDGAVTVFGKSLKKDMPTVVALLAEQLRTPAFDPAEFDKARAQLTAMLKQGTDDTDTRARDALTEKLFTKDSPNASLPREALLKAAGSVTLDQVKAFHARYYGPDHMTLVFVGDIDLATARAEVIRATEGWTGGVDFVRSAPKSPAPQAQTIDVAMNDKASVSVLWGQVTGVRHADADYLPLQVGVNILGSGFTGRLMSTVRDQEGLTYGIGARLFGDDLVDGGFMMQATFAPALLDKGVASARRQLDRWWQDGVTADELDARKQALVGRFQLRLGTTEGMAETLLTTLVRGQDLAWLDAYPQKLEALTLEQVDAAIREHLDPAKMVLVKAGTFSEP